MIETGFGDLRPFNRVVRAILKERMGVELDKEFRPSLVDGIVSNVVSRTRKLRSDPKIVVKIDESAPGRKEENGS